MRTKLLKWLALIALMAYTAFISVWAISRAQATRCRGIEIRVQQKGILTDSTTQAGIVGELARYDSKLIGRPVGQINTEEIEKYFLRFNNFQDVQCALSSSGKLLIDVVPLMPEMRVFSNGDSWYINKDGKRLNADARFNADVPVVAGKFNSRIKPKDLLRLVRFINADKTYRDLFTMVKVDSENDILLIPRVAGHIINLGDTSRLQAKFKKIMTAYHEILPYRGWQTYDTISVKFKGMIVATRRDKSQRSHVPEIEEEVDIEEEALNADAGAQQQEEQPSKPKPSTEE